MGNKIYNHNGKEVKKSAGKNVRISEGGWLKLRKHCIKNGLVLGAFVETAALEKIQPQKSKI